MNHYPMHPGDYLRDTAHLSLIEDAIYRRILDWLYTNERPLPEDVARIAKLIRASEYLDEVSAVVGEFLKLTAGGWVQARVEREVAEYQLRQDAIESREENESDRKRRYNEKRKALFAELRELGGNAPWDANLEHLKSLISSIKDNQGRANDAPRTGQGQNKNGVNQNQNQNQNQDNPPTPQGGEEDELPADWKADTRTMTTMSLDWTPDTNTLNTYLQGKAANGRPVTVADVMARLDDWRENANASGKTMTDAQWTLRLVKYVMACMSSDSAPTGNRQPANQPDPLAFTEENRPKFGPYALLKPGPKKTPLDEEGRKRIEALKQQLFGPRTAA